MFISVDIEDSIDYASKSNVRRLKYAFEAAVDERRTREDAKRSVAHPCGRTCVAQPALVESQEAILFAFDQNPIAIEL